MQEFKLPDLGEGMQEAEIRRWLIQPGDTVKLDQPMLEVETDKAVVEIPAPVAGRISAIHVKEGAVAHLGELLVTFASADAPAQQGRVSSPVPAKAPQETVSMVAAPTEKASTSARRVLAAPAVRKLAFEMGIDLAQVPSSHPTGRVTLDDIQQFAQQQKQQPPAQKAPGAIVERPAPSSTNGVVLSSNGQKKPDIPIARSEREGQENAEERQPLTGLRRRIAEHMEYAWRTIPHATAFGELDGTELVALRRQLKPLAEQRGIHLTYMPLLVKLLLPVLKEFPVFNASFDEERREIIFKRNYHIGIATDSPEGLLVPVLRSADQLSVVQIASQLEHLIAGAQKAQPRVERTYW